MNKNPNTYFWRDSFICTILTILMTGILYFSFIKISALDPFEKAFEDFSLSDLYTAKDFKEMTPTKDIILINIKHADRLEIAKTIEIISKQNPKVIGLDIIFKERKDPQIDSILRSAMTMTKNLVTPFYFDGDQMVTNDNYFLTENQSKGYINLNFNSGKSVVRDFEGVMSVKDSVYFGFATQLAIKSGKLKESSARDVLKDKLLINYTGKTNSFLTFDIEDILANKQIPALKDAIVIMGYLGTPTNNQYDVEDKFFTPLNPNYTGKSVPDMYGVVIYANILKMIITKDFIVKIPNFISYILAFLFCFLMTALGLKIEHKSPFLYHLLIKFLQLLVTVILLYGTLLLLKFNIHISITPVIVLTVLGIGLIVYYGYLFHYLTKKYKWKNYLSEH